MSDKSFKLEEATIEQLHNAIRNGEVTCKRVVEKYIERARKYNGVSSMLVTENGESVEKVPGVERAQSELSFPTDTVKASVILPGSSLFIGAYIQFLSLNKKAIAHALNTLKTITSKECLLEEFHFLDTA